MSTKKKPCLSRKTRKAFIATMLDRFLPKLSLPFIAQETARVRPIDN